MLRKSHQIFENLGAITARTYQIFQEHRSLPRTDRLFQEIEIYFFQEHRSLPRTDMFFQERENLAEQIHKSRPEKEKNRSIFTGPKGLPNRCFVFSSRWLHLQWGKIES